jgi:hypothetical protein
MNSSGEKGAAFIEFALVLPILLTIFVGVLDVGLLLYNQQVLTNASREGARAGIARQPDPPSVALDYCRGSDGKWRLFNLVTTNTTAPIVEEAAPPGDFQEDYTITARYNYPFFLPEFLGFESSQLLVARTTMKMEQLLSPP